MTRAEAWVLHAAAALVGASGVLYGWTRYFVSPEDPYAVVNHPWQPTLLHAHIVVAPALVFACGAIWRDHVWRKLRAGRRPRRRTGWTLALLLFPMIVSGYGLQVSGAPLLRRAWIVVHVATSCLWILAYCVHQASPEGPRRPSRRSGG